VISVAWLRRWGSLPQSGNRLVITRHNNCAIGVKADLTASLPNWKPAKVCHPSRRDLWVDMSRYVEPVCGCLAEGRDKGLGNIDYRDACGNSIRSTLVHDFVRRTQLVIHPRLGLSMFGHHRLGFTGQEDIQEFVDSNNFG